MTKTEVKSKEQEGESKVKSNRGGGRKVKKSEVKKNEKRWNSNKVR